MPTDSTPPLVVWKFADWRSESTSALQLERLKLHEAEVSGFVVEHMAKGRQMRLQSDYLALLGKERARLETTVAVRLRAGRFGVSSFVRGSGS